MVGVRFRTTVGGEFLATFDGSVLDLYGADVPGQGASARFHRELLSITIDDPDRRGSRKVVIYAGPGPGRKTPSRYLEIGADDPSAINFFEHVRAALPRA